MKHSIIFITINIINIKKNALTELEDCIFNSFIEVLSVDNGGGKERNKKNTPITYYVAENAPKTDMRYISIFKMIAMHILSNIFKLWAHHHSKPERRTIVLDRRSSFFHLRLAEFKFFFKRSHQLFFSFLPKSHMLPTQTTPSKHCPS